MTNKLYTPRVGLQYLYVLMVISLTFQISNYLPLLQYHYIFWSIGILFAFLYSFKYLVRPVSFFAYIYLGLVCINCYVGDGYFKTYINCFTEAFSILAPITMLYYVFSRNDRGLFKWIIIAFALFMVESTIVSLVANTLNPGLVRLQSNEETSLANAYILEPFKRLGLTSYSLPHALPILIPAFVCWSKKLKDNYRRYSIAITVCIMLLIYASGSFTALIFGMLVLVFSLMNKGNRRSNNIRFIIIAILLLPLLINTDVQLSIVRFFQGFFDKDSIFADKVLDIEYSIKYDDTEGSVGGRNDMYMITIEEFFRHPLLGSNNELGGHCALIDRLATLGVVGLVPLLLFLYFQVKYTLYYIRDAYRGYYYLGLIAGLLMMSVKGFAGWEMWLCLLFLLPGILWFTDSKIKA